MKDPAFSFYSDNFLGGTSLFTDEQVGKYIRLLCIQHLNGHIDTEDLDRLTGKDQKVKAKFIQDEIGMWYNERLQKEIDKKEKWSKSQTDKINKRWGNTPVDTPVYSGEDSGVIPSVSVPVPDPNSVSKPPISPKGGLVSEIYKAYPRHEGKGAALKAIEKALKKINPERLLEIVQRYAVICQGKDPKFIPHPATWFNQERWDDEGPGISDPDKAIQKEVIEKTADETHGDARKQMQQNSKIEIQRAIHEAEIQNLADMGFDKKKIDSWILKYGMNWIIKKLEEMGKKMEAGEITNGITFLLWELDRNKIETEK